MSVSSKAALFENSIEIPKFLFAQLMLGSHILTTIVIISYVFKLASYSLPIWAIWP
jgi:hypothetical protein